MEYGTALSDILKEKNMRPIDLSKITGISKSYISRILNGEKMPSLNTLQLISDRIKISLNHIFVRSLDLSVLSADDKAELLSQLSKLDKLIYYEEK